MRTGVEPKPAWRSIPAPIRSAVGETLGAAVTTGRRVWGGYGPSPTFRLKLSDGRRAFLKGCTPDATTFMRAAFERELRAYADLRDQINDWTPSVFGSFRKHGWEILLLEDLGPKSVPPWTPGKTKSIVHSFALFHAANKGKPLPNWLRRPAGWFDDGLSWGWIASRRATLERAGMAGRYAAEAAIWFREHGPRLASLSKRLLGASRPQLIHADARSDNLRWKGGRLYLLDWAEAVAGPPEFDAAFFIQSIAVESVLEPEAILRWYEQVHPLRSEVMDAAVCAAAAYFVDRAWMPELPGLPRLRTFQKRQLVVTLKWALRRFGIDVPRWLGAISAT